MTYLTRSNFQPHPFHLVTPSPWPLFTSISLLTLTTTGVHCIMLVQNQAICWNTLVELGQSAGNLKTYSSWGIFRDYTLEYFFCITPLAASIRLPHISSGGNWDHLNKFYSLNFSVYSTSKCNNLNNKNIISCLNYSTSSKNNNNLINTNNINNLKLNNNMFVSSVIYDNAEEYKFMILADNKNKPGIMKKWRKWKVICWKLTGSCTSFKIIF